MALPLYAITLFVSAFILFLVQPMIGKLLLPKLGGTPQVWNTCMVFFQTMLLAGYAYTHFVSTRLKLRQQLLLHGTLLVLPFLVLLPWKSWGIPLPEGPFNLTTWSPDLGVNPIPSALYILLVIVGLPFFVVSTTAPLLQKWFAYTGHSAAKDPYFLYGASNAGSVLGLLSYPFLIERWLRLNEQAYLWTAGFGLLVIAVLLCVAFVWRPAAGAQEVDASSPHDAPPAPPSEVEAGFNKPIDTGITAKAPTATVLKPAPARVVTSVTPAQPGDEVTTLRRLKWIALAAVPSSMMLGVTTHITTDLSPSPTIWLIPLTLYLVSFILVFARWPVVWTEEPHKIFVYLQPIFVVLMLVAIFEHWEHSYLRAAITFDILGFFFTTMVCHGELAKDRPGTKHLTDFYLMMSIGGMLGGMFNGLLAPNIPYLFEFPAAIIAGCLMRPLLGAGLIDGFVASLIDPTAGEGPQPRKGKGHHRPQATPRSSASGNVALTLDLVLPIATAVLSFCLFLALYDPLTGETSTVVGVAYGIPLMITILFLWRPVRFGLAIALILAVDAFNSSEKPLHRTRSYFGLIKVNVHKSSLGEYVGMIHGHIDHGMNFKKPDDKDIGNPARDFSRLATTYYHREGPAGIVMERFCWFHEPENHYNSDSRIGASLVGQLAPALGMTLPIDGLVDLWSEPAYATIGLGTGTMASYARPYQHMHYYEIDNTVKRFSLRPNWTEKGKAPVTYVDFQEGGRYEGQTAPFFSYLRDALGRGAHVQVLMGDARLRMNMPYVTPKGAGYYTDPDMSGGPEDFYHMMVVDAFSSDAIPAHLITKQGIEMYFKHLTKEGILCVHTSNRFVDLVKVVSDVSNDLGYACLRGHDENDDRTKGHYTSEWVMVARKADYLRHLREPPGYRAAVRQKNPNRVVDSYWEVPEVYNRYVWTDDFYNILSVLR